MNKRAFIDELRKRLSSMPVKECEERISFYSEMIDDRVEDGLSEEEAIAAIGEIDDIVAQILSDTVCKNNKIEKPKRKRRLKGGEIALLIIGSPLWIVLIAAALIIILSLYLVIWSLIISLWAIFVSCAACGTMGVLWGMSYTISGQGIPGVALIGAGIALLGLAILLFFGSKSSTTGVLKLTKNIILSIKKRFTKKEEAK